MSVQPNMFQPGLILYEVVLGAFKASGIAFQVWCQDNNVNATVARNALKGVNTGTAGQAVRAKLIEAAGPEVVEIAYRTRMNTETARVNAAAAGARGVAA